MPRGETHDLFGRPGQDRATSAAMATPVRQGGAATVLTLGPVDAAQVREMCGDQVAVVAVNGPPPPGTTMGQDHE